MWSVAVFLLAIGVSSTTGVCHNIKCTEPDGYFAHPQSCVEYVKCVAGKAYVKKCPANLHYNEFTGMCDLVKSSQCIESVKEKNVDCSLGRRAMISRSAGSVPGIECDCGKCCRKPHESDCTKFYECDENGAAQEKVCGGGLVYNPIVEDCDLAVNYQCPTVHNCSCKCRYPADGECNAFYLCEEVGGTVSKHYCSEGLMFNAATEMCDRPAHVDCPSTAPITTPPPTGPLCKDHKADCANWAASGDCVCDSERTGGGVDCSWERYVRTNCPASCRECGGEGAASTEDSNEGGSEENGSKESSSKESGSNESSSKESGSKESGSKESGSKESGSKESGSKESGSKESGSKESGSKESNSKGSGSKESGSKESGSKESGSRESGSRQSREASGIDLDLSRLYGRTLRESTSRKGKNSDEDSSKESGSKENGSKESGSKESGSKESGSKESGSKESGSKESGSKESGSKESGSKESGSRENGSKESGSKESRSKESESKESGSKESGNKESGSKESGSKESGSRESGSKESGSKESGSKESESKESESNESGDSSEVFTVGPCEIDCSDGHYFRHPSDCQKFIQCTPFGPWEMSCRNGDRWNQDTLQCSQAQDTPCIIGNGACVTEPTHQPPPEVCEFVCPNPNGEFPHPSDCSKWVHCSNNIPHVKNCPASLHFDAILRVCNWPKDAQCFSDENYSGCDIPIVPTPSLPLPIVPPSVCDCECCLRPHPEDCQSYYYCDGTNTEFHTCSEGLVFDPEEETCVYAQEYPECVPDLPPECECECLYPSPVCTEYYRCEDNVPKKYECPNGLYFNPTTHSCDNPTNVDCQMPAMRTAVVTRRRQPISGDDCAVLPNGRYPSKRNPAEFYTCHDGVAYQTKCNSGAHFDGSTLTCIKNI